MLRLGAYGSLLLIWSCLASLATAVNPNFIIVDKTKSKNLDADAEESAVPHQHPHPNLFGYPDVHDAYITPGVEPLYAYYPSPDDDGTYIKVLLQDEMFPPGTPAPVAGPPVPVKFYLYTKNNTDKPIELYPFQSNRDYVASYFDPEAPVKILCHGYLSNAHKKFPDLMRQAYLTFGPYLNIIVLDWGSMANTANYPKAAKNTKIVGEQTALLIQQLIDDGLTDLKKIHFIGHSLGAQAGGAVAYQLERKNLEKMDRITGLDPAGPFFCEEENKRLHEDDADFVDVIHTDDGLYCEGWFPSIMEMAKGKWGSSLTVGTVDFYPNGGAHQAGCATGLLVPDTCSHSRSYYYMEESFNSTETKEGYAFKGCQCESYTEYVNDNCPCTESSLMGEFAKRSAKGKYFLRTGKKYPYAFVN